MTSPDLIRRAVEDYLRLLQVGTAEELTGLFADDASIEDPAGSPAKVGRTAIQAHFDLAAPYDMSTELLALRIVEDSAAAYFRVTTKTADATYVSEPIDVFSVTSDGKFASMRAYWGEHDYTAP